MGEKLYVRTAGRFFTQSTRAKRSGGIAAASAISMPAMGERGMKTMEMKIIGVFPISNTGSICVHAIDHAEDKVLASINGENPEWCAITEKPQSEMGAESDELELGFLFGSFFVPFSEVMRMEI